MGNKILELIRLRSDTEVLFGSFALIVIGSILISIVSGNYLLAGLPPICLLLYLTIVDVKAVFFLLIATIPLSTEIYLPNGFGTDLPTEPLMIVLMLAFGLYYLQKPQAVPLRFLGHPITLLLGIHVGWIFITTITSSLFLVSLKFSLAKTWYVVVFYFLAGAILRSERDFRRLFWYFFLPLLFTIVVIMVKHASYQFSFSDVYQVLHPFYRNHVAYAGIMALFFPFVVFARHSYPTGSFLWWLLVGSSVLILIAIYLSYTRAAYLSLAIAGVAYFIFRMRLIRYVILLSVLITTGAVLFFVNDNKYLEYAPNFERTISHNDFDNLITATYQMEDISTMERLHRWVAGFHMAFEKPIFGFGPGNFTSFYKSYTVTSFRTYVSNNPNKSGIHSYYLMTLVEQGIIGLLVFLLLSFYVLAKGEDVYHQTDDPGRKRMVMTVLLCTIIIDSFLIINDLIETDKVGPLFFISIAVVVNADLANRQRSSKKKIP